MLYSILFYTFSLILVLSALKVIIAKNLVHSALFLVLGFVTSACLWIMLNVDFLALVLILVYVGAVMVLFLFVVMMLDVEVEALRSGFWKNLPLALVLGVVVLAEMLMVILNKNMQAGDSLYMQDVSNYKKLSYTLYVQYSYPIELASIILLLGLVVAVALTLRHTSEKKGKYQNIPQQVNTKAKDRLTIIEMPSETQVGSTNLQGDK